jgi:hypothetical protein
MTPVAAVALGQLNFFQKQLAVDEAAAAGGAACLDALPVVDPSSRAAAGAGAGAAGASAAASSDAPKQATLRTLVSSKEGPSNAADAAVNGNKAL